MKVNVSILAVTSIAIILLIISFNPTHGEPVDRYWSVLKPYNQSFTHSKADGFIGVKFTEDYNRLVYSVNVNNIDNITGIYLYSRGNETESAKVIFDLLKEAREVKVKEKFKETSALIIKTKEIEGTVVVGGVTPDDLHGIMKGKSLKDLRKMLTKGDTFVVVTTADYPKGEIGGTDFVPIERFFPDTSDFHWKS